MSSLPMGSIFVTSLGRLDLKRNAYLSARSSVFLKGSLTLYLAIEKNWKMCEKITFTFLKFLFGSTPVIEIILRLITVLISMATL